jgi:hypothetical protein
MTLLDFSWKWRFFEELEAKIAAEKSYKGQRFTRDI